MTHHPACRELHTDPPVYGAVRLNWQHYNADDTPPLKELIWTCTGPACTNLSYQFNLTSDDRYALTRTDREHGQTDIYAPADQGSVLNLWLDLLTGKAL